MVLLVIDNTRKTFRLRYSYCKEGNTKLTITMRVQWSNDSYQWIKKDKQMQTGHKKCVLQCWTFKQRDKQLQTGGRVLQCWALKQKDKQHRLVMKCCHHQHWLPSRGQTFHQVIEKIIWSAVFANMEDKHLEEGDKMYNFSELFTKLLSAAIFIV